MATTLEVTRAAAELRVVVGQLVRRVRAEHRFPLCQAVVLGRLDREGPRTTSALAAAERMTPQSMARTVAELEASGLVSRGADPTDARQRPVALTAAGRAALADERSRREGWLARAIADTLSEEEQTILVEAVELLRRLAAAESATQPEAVAAPEPATEAPR